MTVTTHRLARTPRRTRRVWAAHGEPVEPQARPRYQLRDPKPTPLRAWRTNGAHDWSELVGGIVCVIAAVYLWEFVRWH